MDNEKQNTDLFAVMKLNETVEVDYFGQKRKIKIEGIRGFIPVFDTYEEAVENSNNGECQIITISLPQQN